MLPNDKKNVPVVALGGNLEHIHRDTAQERSQPAGLHRSRPDPAGAVAAEIRPTDRGR